MNIALKEELSAFGAKPVSVDIYCSPEHFELECRHVFKKTWLYAGREFDIPEPGDYFVKNLDFLHTSVLVVRGSDGKLRAFHNVCSHRQSTLAWDQKGHARRFVCKYHGWGYDLEGNLRSVPDEQYFYGLDKSRCGLTPLAVDAVSGLVFINLDPAPEQTLRQSLGEIVGRLAEFPLEEWSRNYTFSAEIPTNWKCIVDNFQETYHVSCAHAVSVGDRSVGPENPMGHPLKFEFFGLHRGMDIWANPEHKPTLVESYAVRDGGIVGQTTSENRSDNAAMFVFGLFPNIVLNVTPYFLQLHELVPISAGRTHWSTTAFFPAAKNAGQRMSQEYSSVLLRDITAEDLGILGSLQKNMLSGARKEIQFQAIEVLCRHMVNGLEKYIRDGQEREQRSADG